MPIFAIFTACHFYVVSILSACFKCFAVQFPLSFSELSKRFTGVNQYCMTVNSHDVTRVRFPDQFKQSLRWLLGAQMLIQAFTIAVQKHPRLATALKIVLSDWEALMCERACGGVNCAYHIRRWVFVVQAWIHFLCTFPLTTKTTAWNVADDQDRCGSVQMYPWCLFLVISPGTSVCRTC